MRTKNLVATIAGLLVLTSGVAAHAEGLNNLAAGFNGLLTSPLDPVLFTIEPPEAFEGVRGEPVTSGMLGFFAGVLMVPYRAIMGALDIALFPFWVFPTLSPEARVNLFSVAGYEIEYE
ncbi:MAG: hypothetical protein JRG80_08150 [Deltaproteobacteria bacterium]|nr:hypothetical protein [Deltaproteobacteria bacterium]MBW2399230.1 hypothetical protein [Deltaproteobacteria bacterium]MBW2667356.1 hypothetical protein [Deltaproteobacteria bacterium]